MSRFYYGILGPLLCAERYSCRLKWRLPFGTKYHQSRENNTQVRMDKTTGNRKFIAKVLVCVLVFCLVILIGLVYSLVDTYRLAKRQELIDRIGAKNQLINPQSTIYELRSKFEAAMEFELLQRSIYVFKNVCLENDVPQTMGYILPSRTAYFNVTKRIVVYNHWGYSNRTLAVAGSGNSVFNRWDIQLVRHSIPTSHVLLNQTAFFVVQTCPGNLHHFWEDEFRDLFSVVWKMDRLSTKGTNQVLYKLPSDIAPEDMACFNITRYEPLLGTLQIHPVHDAFYRMPQNTCYKEAVFGVANLLANDSRKSVEYVLKHLNVSRSSCPNIDNTLTIIQRKHRRILNPVELIDTAVSAGFEKAQLVILEELSVREQLQIATCSRVLVGVQGAGLQWSIFMPKHSSLIEISWPTKFWPGYFRQFVTQYGIIHFDLEAQFVRINWKAYQEQVRLGNEVPLTERARLMKQPPKNAIDNIWKWADAIIEVTEFKSLLDSILYNMEKQL